MIHLPLNDLQLILRIPSTFGETPRTTSTFASVPVLMSGMGTTPTTSEAVALCWPDASRATPGLSWTSFMESRVMLPLISVVEPARITSASSGVLVVHQRSPEAVGQRKHGQKDADRSGNPEDGHVMASSGLHNPPEVG